MFLPRTSAVAEGPHRWWEQDVHAQPWASSTATHGWCRLDRESVTGVGRFRPGDRPWTRRGPESGLSAVDDRITQIRVCLHPSSVEVHLVRVEPIGGPVQQRHCDEVMELAADVPRVAFVNVRVPRSWEATSNRELEDGVARYDNAVLVDWYDVTWDKPNLFAADGVHPKQPGRVIMAELIAQGVFPNWVPLEE